MGETTPCIAVSNPQQWPCWAKDQTFLVDFLKNWWISQFSRRLGFISCFTSRLGGFAAAFWSFYGPPPINPSFASVWTHGWLMFRLKLQKIILIGEVHFSFSCRGFTRLRFSEFFGFSMADFCFFAESVAIRKWSCDCKYKSFLSHFPPTTDVIIWVFIKVPNIKKWNQDQYINFNFFLPTCCYSNFSMLTFEFLNANMLLFKFHNVNICISNDNMLLFKFPSVVIWISPMLPPATLVISLSLCRHSMMVQG